MRILFASTLFFIAATSAAATPLQAADLLASVEERGRSETFLAMLEQSGLRSELERSQAPLTLIIPTDAAFVGIPGETIARLFEPGQRGTLRQILQHHVVPGEVPRAGQSLALAVAGSARTLAGTELSFTLREGRLRVDGVPFVATDMTANSGAYHEIGSVLLPDPSALEPTAARRIAARALRTAAGAGLDATAEAAVLETAYVAVMELEPTAGFSTDLVVRAFDSPENRAGALRTSLLGLFDEGSRRTLAAAATPTMNDDATPLIRFDGSEGEPGWFTLNDDVMGGISNSSFQRLDGDGDGTSDGRAVFSGALSLENNGGFATIRSQAQDYDLTGYTGLRLRVRTDGREYGVSALAGDERGRTGSWRKRFQVPAAEWTTVDVPFADMVLNIRGRQYPEVGPPDLAAIRSFSFIIADKDESPFRMEIESIAAYR
ncbi:MAG: CIA30 family protein [Planctomycetota bacterium]